MGAAGADGTAYYLAHFNHRIARYSALRHRPNPHPVILSSTLSGILMFLAASQ